MKNQFKFYAFFAAVVLVISSSLNSCKPENPHDDHEHDAVTKLQLLFVDSATNNAAGTFTWDDPDGIGGNSPTQIDTIQLIANKTYRVSIMFYAKHDNHEDNLTPEIVAEKNDHLFVYKNITGNLSVQITDKDDKNLPIGLESKWRTGAPSTGSINIILRHQPGLKDGTEIPGDTDVDVVFPLNIQ
jgi:hypothetical protein